MFTLLGILSFIITFGSIACFCKSYEICFTNEARGEIRRWAKRQKISHEVLAMMEVQAERRKNFLRYCVQAIMVCFFLVGILGLIFCIFFGGQISNPPAWSQDYTISLQKISLDPDYYVMETNTSYLISTDTTGVLPIEKSDFKFSLSSLPNFWNNLTIKEVSGVSPSMTVYHGENRTGDAYTKIVLLVPPGSVGG